MTVPYVCRTRSQPRCNCLQNVCFCAACGALLEEEQLVGGWAGGPSAGGHGVWLQEDDDGRTAGCHDNLLMRSGTSQDVAKKRRASLFFHTVLEP